VRSRKGGREKGREEGEKRKSRERRGGREMGRKEGESRSAEEPKSRRAKGTERRPEEKAGRGKKPRESRPGKARVYLCGYLRGFNGEISLRIAVSNPASTAPYLTSRAARIRYV
jgi:hypothetical protein